LLILVEELQPEELLDLNKQSFNTKNDGYQAPNSFLLLTLLSAADLTV
jgi:hypothetical protein